MQRSLGISGCKLEFIERDGKQIVRKTSANPQYTSRLQAQAMKQHLCSLQINANWLYGSVYVPNVYEFGDNYFDMEYVPAMGYIEFVEYGSVSGLQNAFNTIVNTVWRWASASGRTRDAYPFVERTVTALLNEEYVSDKYKELAKQLLDVGPIIVKTGSSHGDLTMSNILFEDGRVVLIDWLDRVPSSYIFDVIKLRQDAVYDWTSINTSVYHDRNKAKLADLHLGRMVEDTFQELIKSHEFKILEVCNWLSVMRYTGKYPEARRVAERAFLECLRRI